MGTETGTETETKISNAGSVTSTEIPKKQIAGDQIKLELCEPAIELNETLTNPNSWDRQITADIRLGNSRALMYEGDNIYKQNEARILSYSYQYELIAKKIQIYISLEKYHRGRKQFAKTMAEICAESNARMEKVWLALIDQADKDERNEDLLRLEQKINGVKLLGNNYEALVQYAILMQMNLNLDRINNVYDITGKITAIDDSNKSVTFTNLKTDATNQVIFIRSDDTFMFDENDINKILSFDIIYDEDDEKNYIDKDSNGVYSYELKEDTSEQERLLWNALAADLQYTPKLPNMNDYTTDAKRNYEYEKDLNEAQIDNFRYRNMSALGNFYLSIAKYAERMANEADDGSDDQKVWKRVKTDAMIMFKKYKQIAANPNEQNKV